VDKRRGTELRLERVPPPAGVASGRFGKVGNAHPVMLFLDANLTEGI